MKTGFKVWGSLLICMVSAGWIVADPHGTAGAVLGFLGIGLYVWGTTEEREEEP